MTTSTRRRLGAVSAAVPGALVPAAWAAACVVPLLLVMGWPALQDFGEWLYEGYVLHHLTLGGGSGGSGDLLFGLRDYPVPYAVAQVLLAVPMTVLSPSASGVLAIVVQLALGCAAVGALIARRRLAPVPAALALTVLVVLTSAFWNGYAGHQLGLALIAAYLALSARTSTRAGVVLAFSLVAFFTHGLVYAAFGLIAGVRGLSARRLHWVALGSAPSLALAGWYAVANTEATGAGELNVRGLVEMLAYKAYTLMKAGGYQNLVVNGVGDPRPLMLAGAALNAAFVAALALLVVARARQVGLRAAASPEMVAGLALVALAMALPSSLFEVVNPGERLLGPAGICLVVATMRTPAPRWTSRALGATAAAGLALTLVGSLLLPHKSAQGDPAPSDPSPSFSSESSTRTDMLFSHRLDQYESRRALAERLWADRADPTEPLLFKTTVLTQRPR